MNNYEILGIAFAGENPCGVNLRTDSTLVSVYQAIRDARSTARSEDRTIENPAIISQDDERNARNAAAFVHKPSGQWRNVHDLSFEALSLHTKDIEIFSWLMEAAVRIEGINALAEILAAFEKIAKTDFDRMHSIDDEDLSDKLAPLTGLNGSQDDGTLVRPLRLVSLLPNESYGRFSLWTFDQAFRDLSSPEWAEFRDALEHVDAHGFSRNKNDAARALAILTSIDDYLVQKIENNIGAFSVSRIQAVLESINGAYGEMGKLVTQVIPAQPVIAEPLDSTPTAKPNGSHPVAAPTGAVQNREQAFEQLLQIASFFRASEPNSAIPLALETLVRRGRMDFLRLLEELIPQDDLRRDVLLRAGIDANSQREGN
ncbi:hypothetical protein HB779_25250 (plasmid) [Phyllobacterium sp. 628]|uniref:type VI secretion system protein TssA n=1 Tax=Phyllobacterium sp. 628 TaxID=2718938 RepID=UPI0016622BCA|nr:type VI secretion system ImpA family N-terminal domain-containing protein [Phyllobacterium sp. 628]QND55163.1 hypothetical protein HB779_25250 [Phyllobacterium sp. 628]